MIWSSFGRFIFRILGPEAHQLFKASLAGT